MVSATVSDKVSGGDPLRWEPVTEKKAIDKITEGQEFKQLRAEHINRNEYS